jgi:hypothetical protein
MSRSLHAFALAADAITVEGALIPPAMMARVAAQEAEGQRDVDYGIPKGLTLRDEIARYFRIGQALFTELNASATPSAARTVTFAEALFRDVFGFADIARIGTRSMNERLYAITLEGLSGRVPVVVVPPSDSLDRASDHLPTDGRRRSAASAVQDWLNAQEGALWGFCCNGERLRLLRDNASLTRPAYIEADLRQIFDAESFADFAVLWLLIHASRFGRRGAPATDCVLERWRESGSREGIAARERLRDGVEAALKALGTGFLTGNSALRQRVQNGELALSDFFGQLLRIVYRLIFLLAAEDRGLLHAPDASPAARLLYARGYSMDSLRDRAIRRTAWDAHYDKWEGLAVVFAALARGEKLLGLPALGGLFAPDMVADLESARLSNRAHMEAIFRLAWLREEAGLMPVNWRDMETVELGSVYESLLELTPRLVEDGRGFAFAEGGEAKGHARKTTGSYYTPDSLVQELLDSTLDPVLDRVEAEADDPCAALLGVTVIDPACGSGHFLLLAAGRRIATRLARARAGGVASAEDFRHALRDVARSCLHGVDRNPMAVELTKVALWIETVEPGKPLGFLDANIRCGDALLGVFDINALEAGIPDAAYKPLTGDDRTISKCYAARNRDDLRGQGRLDFAGAGRGPRASPLAKAWSALRALPEDSGEQVAEKRRLFEAVKGDRLSFKWGEAADLYIAAFLLPKTGETPAVGQVALVPTTGDVRRALADKQVHPQLVARATEAAREARAFHWPLEFPDVMASGGFDVVLGNPPWDRVKLQEQEFFAALDPDIADAPNAAARGRLIAALEKAKPGTRERDIYEAFETAKRLAEASSVFARESGRFPLTGRGDVNTYALFAEHFARLTSSRGRAGVIVPTGIATDATTAPFFAALIEGGRLGALYSFENEEMVFPSVHHSMKFCLLAIRPSTTSVPSDFVFFARSVADISNEYRRFTLSPTVIGRMNPNTKTAPVFRSRADAELTTEIYGRVPVLIDEAQGAAGNPWGVSFVTMFHMANDSALFRTSGQLVGSNLRRTGLNWIGPAGEVWVPLYVGKMFDFYDHRAASYASRGSARGFRVLPETSLEEHRDPSYEVEPFYWIQETDLNDVLDPSVHEYIAFSMVTGSSNERTFKCYLVPRGGLGDSANAIYIQRGPELKPLLLSIMSSIVFDYLARVKVGE